MMGYNGSQYLLIEVFFRGLNTFGSIHRDGETITIAERFSSIGHGDIIYTVYN